MKKVILGTVLLLTAAVVVLGQQKAQPKKFALFAIDEKCVCVATQKQPKTLTVTETKVGNSLYQVFSSRTTPGRELFRVEVGKVTGSGTLKWWHYGIVEESDFNGDSLTDYSWYGGDDTTSDMYLFLSTGGKYQRVDVLKTVQSAWRHRFHQTAPDLGDSGGNYGLGDCSLERSEKGIILLASVEPSKLNGASGPTYQFRIPEADFVP